MQNTFFKDFHVHITTDKGLIEYNKLTVVTSVGDKKNIEWITFGQMDYGLFSLVHHFSKFLTNSYIIKTWNE